MVSRRTRYRRPTGPGLGYSSTQHCRCDRGGQREFQRPESGGHGGCRCDRRVADSHAGFTDARKGWLGIWLIEPTTFACRIAKLTDNTEHLKSTARLMEITGFKEGEARTLQGKIFHQLRETLAMFLYLWVLFALFTYHESIVLAERNISYVPYGLAFFNALVLA